MVMLLLVGVYVFVGVKFGSWFLGILVVFFVIDGFLWCVLVL